MSPRGRLTIFFGAAPGVGKTFSMLREASVLADVDGRDVVAGVVETHGRFETATLLSGFERLPRKKQGELDLDGALARRPSLILIDELAHANAPGGRHDKRWQDTEELLDAGIDVYTTLDVQEVESLKDVVMRITGVVAKDTVPDKVIDAAHDIKLIDLPPDELLERLREGKVYLPARIDADRATRNLFQKGNLLALRELALRKTAERVDADMNAWRSAHGIAATWAAADRILVCIGPSPTSASLLRVGRRMAAGLRAPWFAATVETAATRRLGPADRARISQNLKLGQQLGAETVTLSGEKAADEILRFARERNVTKIVVGKPRPDRPRSWLGASFVDELLLGSGDIDIYATHGDDVPGELAPRAAALAVAPAQDGRGYAAALITVVLASLVSYFVFGRNDLADIVMTYLLGIVLVAMRFGFRAALASAVLGVLAFDYFFVPPYLTFSVADIRHVVTFGVMLLVAVVIATLTQRVRDQAEVARRSEGRTAVLYAMSRELSRTEGLGALLRVASQHLERVFEARIAILSVDKSSAIQVGHATAEFSPPIDHEATAIRWVLEHRREAGLGTATLGQSQGFYVPLLPAGASAAALGVLAIYPDQPSRFEDPEQQRLADAFAAQIAMAFERASLSEETERAHLAVEAEQLRSTLLSSVSHDLRTPLAVMKGATSLLVDDSRELAAGTRRELAQAVWEESDRLERLVRNLLDMTRLESGAVQIHKEWQSVEEVVGTAISRVESRLAGRPLRTRVGPELIAPLDAVLVEQLLVNLLENALKYTPPGTPIDVEAEERESEVVVTVSDHGPGVREEERERIFDKFHRGPQERTGGVGLGLTICRAIAVAHGGRIWVEPRAAGGEAGAGEGASFRFALPIEGARPAPPDVG
jgi:two-component system sensor histidine kinase KdpD